MAEPREPRDRPITSYRVDADSIRVNNPDPKEPDLMVRRLATGKLKAYEQAKKRGGG